MADCPRCIQPADVLGSGALAEHVDEFGTPCVLSGEQPWTEASTRPVVRSRSGGVCEYCQATRATQMHHRVSRGVRGKWTPANIIHLCTRCHTFVTQHPAWAYSIGLMVKSSDDPEATPVQRDNGFWFQPTSAVTHGGA